MGGGGGRINWNGKAGDGICFMGTRKGSRMNVNVKGKGKSRMDKKKSQGCGMSGNGKNK